MAPVFEKVDCIRISVPDLDAGLAFYRDRLGHELAWRTGRQLGLRMAAGDAEIVLHTEPKAVEVDLTVRSADRAAERIRQAGGEIRNGPFDIQVGRCVVIADPWQNELVLLDLSKGLLETDSEYNVIGNLEATMAQTASATFTIDSWEEEPYAELGGDRKLTRAQVRKTYRGDIEGNGSLEYLLAYGADGSASFVGIERVDGRVGDRAGGFVLQHVGRFEGGVAQASLQVVPGSGSGQLVGLRGEGSYALVHAEEYPFTLNVRFEGGP